MSKTTDFATLMVRYLTNYLPAHCNASSNTILSYRDMFKLIIRFAEKEQGIKPEKLTLANINKDFTEKFLGWIETTLGRSIATRNQRLALLHGFCKYLQREKPEYMMQCQQILSIPIKKKSKPTINYLSVDAIKLLLRKPDTIDRYGLRDSVVLSLLYDSGCRVSELVSMCPMDLQLKKPATVTVMGKGRKKRACPISEVLAGNLTEYLKQWNLNSPEKANHPLFTNHSGEQIGRGGVKYILDKYTQKANDDMVGIITDKISPHILRHSKAMHLLQTGVNLIYIRDYLGHEHVQTTEVYARADPEMKRAAIEKVALSMAPQSNYHPWVQDGELMGFLNSLGK